MSYVDRKIWGSEKSSKAAAIWCSAWPALVLCKRDPTLHAEGSAGKLSPTDRNVAGLTWRRCKEATELWLNLHLSSSYLESYALYS